MSRRRVLAISQDLDQLRRIVANLERAGADVDAVRSASAVRGDPIPHRYVFFALGRGGREVLDEALPRFRDVAQIALLVPQARLPDLTRFLDDPRLNHVIVGEELDRGVFITGQKLLTGDFFGIEKYLPEGTPVHYLRVRDAEGRRRAVDEVLEFAAESRMRRQVRSAIGSVTEELLMNALYDAPVGEDGRPLFASASAEAAGSVSPRPVSIRYAATESQFAVAVRDRFGRLAKRSIVGALERCLRDREPLDRQKAFGAGLGLYLIANAAASCVFNVAYDVATEVVCTFDRGAKSPLRLIGVFVHPEGAEELEQAAGRAAGQEPAARAE